jgi:hypothetical protein
MQDSWKREMCRKNAPQQIVAECHDTKSFSAGEKNLLKTGFEQKREQRRMSPF